MVTKWNLNRRREGHKQVQGLRGKKVVDGQRVRRQDLQVCERQWIL